MGDKNKTDKRHREEDKSHEKKKHHRHEKEAEAASPPTITFKNFPNTQFSTVDGKFYPQHVFGYMTIILEARDAMKNVSNKQADGTVTVTSKTVSTNFILLPGADGGVPVEDKHEYSLQQLSELPPRQTKVKSEEAAKREIKVKEEPKV